ncbi:MAG: rhodanese-like domain-containing protein [Proteobacteria bacterium]|nr:rhodanese-like domain-containing protein [Pseudomonadota bacterium]
MQRKFNLEIPLIKPTVLILLTILCLTSFAGSKQFITDISVETADATIKKNQEKKRFQILDIRTPKEFQYGHLKGALLVDFYGKNFTQQMNKLEKDKTYLIYCHSGARTRLVVEILKQLEFKSVYIMSQGIIGWARAGLKIVR